MSATFTERLLWGRPKIHALNRGQFELVSEMGGSLKCGFALTSGPLGKFGGLEMVQQRHPAVSLCPSWFAWPEASFSFDWRVRSNGVLGGELLSAAEMGAVGRQQGCVFQRTSETPENEETPVMVGGSSSLKSLWTAVWPCLFVRESSFCVRSVARSFTRFFTSPPSRRLRATPAPPRDPPVASGVAVFSIALATTGQLALRHGCRLSRWGTDVEPSGFRAGVLQLLCVVSRPRVTSNVMVRDLRAEVLNILIAVHKCNGRNTEHVRNMPEVRRSLWTWGQEWAAYDRRRRAVWSRTHDHERIRHFGGQCSQIKTPTSLRMMTDTTDEHVAGSRSCV